MKLSRFLPAFGNVLLDYMSVPAMALLNYTLGRVEGRFHRRFIDVHMPEGSSYVVRMNERGDGFDIERPEA